MYAHPEVCFFLISIAQLKLMHTNTIGLRMASFHGNFFVRSTDLLAMPAVPQDQSYAIEVQIEEAITTPVVVFQTAVLHTTCYGEKTFRLAETKPLTEHL